MRRGKRIMKNYKQWSAAERRKSGEKAYEAIQKGIIQSWPGKTGQGHK